MLPWTGGAGDVRDVLPWSGDGWRCCECGRAGRLEVDHIQPLHRGGAPYALENLQALCAFPCHGAKTRRENTLPTPGRDAWRELVARMVAP